MDLKVPIILNDEVGDEVIVSNAKLNLASGEITHVRYEEHDADALGYPWEMEDYDCTSGSLFNGDKVVEFMVIVNKGKEQYSVSADELAEIKLRAAALFTSDPNAVPAPELAHKPNPKGMGALSAGLNTSLNDMWGNKPKK